MVKVELKGVQAIKKRLANGEVHTHYYHRASRTKLPGEPGETGFIARLNELNAQMESEPERPKIRPQTVDALAEHYIRSQDFKGLAAKTRKDYMRYIDEIRMAWGKNRVASIDREAVLNLRDGYQDTPRTANYGPFFGYC